MSDVTPKEIIGAVASAYGMDAELVKHGGPRALSKTEARQRLQARMVAIHLIRVHTKASGQMIIKQLALPNGADGYDLISLAECMVGPYLDYDERMAKRVARAEDIIDRIHERRVGARLSRQGVAA